MRRILVYKNIDEIEYALFKKTNYKTVYQIINTERKGNWANFANKLWLQGLVSEISTAENHIEYMTKPMDSQYINNHFDSIIFPSANIFSPDYCEAMERLADEFSEIRIPILVISCGVQAKSYAALDELIHQIKRPACRFIDAVYRTGGEFSLRGYFTKEFFDKLGFSNAVVTGCPSLYQNGRELSIVKKEIEKEQLKPIINGQNYMFSTKFYYQIFQEYKDAIFIDQDHFGQYLYDADTDIFDNMDLKKMVSLVKKESYLALELLSSGRIQYFIDMPNWREYIKKEGYNFSFGGRIHGNIMSLLSGIPSVVYVCDSRTREMAEFFDIPIVEPNNKKSLYEIYCDCDFSKFNQTFKGKYDFYKEFLINHNLIDDKMNDKNIFFQNNVLADSSAPFVNNKEKLYELQRKLKEMEYMLKIEDAALHYIRMMKNN